VGYIILTKEENKANKDSLNPYSKIKFALKAKSVFYRSALKTSG